MAEQLSQEILLNAKVVWDYMHMNHALAKADVIFVLGSHDVRVAEWAAQLYLEGYAPKILFSGGYGRHTDGVFQKTEAEVFADLAMKKGVPLCDILIEKEATNTGENIQLGQLLMKEQGISVSQMILVQKPYMERRTYATFMKQWIGSQVEFCVTSPDVSFRDYPNADISMTQLIDIMIGDLQRINDYPAKGFQIEQDIPDDVWQAYLFLVKHGFDSNLI